MESNDAKSGRSRHGFAFGLVMGGLLGVALSGAVALGAGALAAGHFGGGHVRPGFFRHDDPEAAREHVALAADWMLTRVDATEAQKGEAKRIVREAFDELMPLIQEHRSSHETFVEEMTRANLDPEAIERLRQDQVDLFDRASRRVSASLTELAAVLTPEQRAELVSMARKFRH
ncbi:MAG TPA: Spy/CpxP family protein refolding chaperone [Vicinamibacteria bacterium]|nr:Spy/CpxP family protein refolding chaperone [Vicinamibacteria bacterium]